MRPTLVTHVADLCLYSATAAQPEHGILTAFLSSSRDTDRRLWAHHIGWRLDKLQPAEAQGNWERWIKDYWARRLDNRPVRLTVDEGGQMLDWVLPAGDLFPEAVGLLVKSPSRFPGAFLFFRNQRLAGLGRTPRRNRPARRPRPDAPRWPGRVVRGDRLGPARAHRHRRP